MKGFFTRTGFPLRAAILTLALLLGPAGQLQASETIRVGVYDNPPKVFLTGDGIAAGLYPDILNAIARERGWVLKWMPGTWHQCLERLKAGEIDLMVDIAKTEERLTQLSYSQEPVLTNWGAVYTRKGIRIEVFKDLKGKSVAVVKDSAHTEGIKGFRQLMDRFGISCRYIEVDSYRKAMMLLDSSQVDACVVNRLFGTLYANNYDVVTTPLIFSPKVLFFAAPKDREMSTRILGQIDENLVRFKRDPDSFYHKAMGYYLSGGRYRLQDIQAPYLRPTDLTETEKLWITAHPVIRFAVDPHFAPFESVSDTGEFTGMAADYLDLIRQKTGLTFERVALDTWDGAVQAAKEGRVDLLPCLVGTQTRHDFLRFSTPYIQFSRVIITAMASPFGRLNGIEDLEGLKVGVQRQSSHHDFLKRNSRLTPVLFKTFEEAVIALSRGEIDAVIGTWPWHSTPSRNSPWSTSNSPATPPPSPRPSPWGYAGTGPSLRRFSTRPWPQSLSERKTGFSPNGFLCPPRPTTISD